MGASEGGIFEAGCFAGKAKKDKKKAV